MSRNAGNPGEHNPEEPGLSGSHPGGETVGTDLDVEKVQGIEGDWWVLSGEGHQEFIAARVDSWAEPEP